jgi:hypothetical protein
MTHTLHRQGTMESLEKDYVVFAMPSSGLNSEGSKPKLAKVFDIFKKYNPVNIGDSKGGSRFSLGSDEAAREILVENELVHAVYRSRDQVIQVLKDLKDEDMGLSVTVSGLMESVHDCCRQAGLSPHTVVMSLGVWGKTGLLPEEKVQKVATMCGHGLVSYDLVRELAREVKEGRMTAKKAGEMLAKPCICGVFNPERAAELLEELDF